MEEANLQLLMIKMSSNWISLVSFLLLTLFTFNCDELPDRHFPNDKSSNHSTFPSSTQIFFTMEYYWNKEEYPNPLEEPNKCGQTKKSLLCDPDHLLTPSQTDEIDNLLLAPKRSSQCFCLKCPQGEAGIKIGLALAANIYSGYNDVSNQAAQTFADYLFRKWHFGLCNDSILILLIKSYPDSKSYSITISKGHIAERVLSGDFFSHLIHNQATKNKQDNFQMLRSILMATNEYVEQIKDPLEKISISAMATEQNGSSGSRTALIVVAIISGFIFFLAFMIGAVILLKRHYERDPDPKFPNTEQNHTSYQEAVIDESEAKRDHPKEDQVPLAMHDDEDQVGNEILGDESRISTPSDSPKQR